MIRDSEKSNPFVLGVAACVIVVVTACLPYPGVSPSNSFSPPSLAAPLGTDALGRSVLYRTFLAFGYTLGQAIIVLVASFILGSLAAVTSALNYEEWPDRCVILVAETIRSYPALILVLLFASVGAPPSLLLVTYFWIPIWRELRFELATQQREPYVLWMRLLGLSRLETLFSEVFPNILPRALPYSTGLLSEVISAQASIEFLGFGPGLEQPSIGGILLEAGQVGYRSAWVWVPSLLLLVATVLLIGRAIRAYRGDLRWVPVG